MNLEGVTVDFWNYNVERYLLHGDINFVSEESILIS